MTQPTLDEIIAALDPAGELHEARRLLDALATLIDGLEGGEDVEPLMGVLYAANEKIDAALKMLAVPPASN